MAQQFQEDSTSNLSSNKEKGKAKFAPNAAPMKPEKVSEMNMDTEGAPPLISDELIAARAIEIWDQSGRILGRDTENWLQAEDELRNRKAKDLE